MSGMRITDRDRVGGDDHGRQAGKAWPLRSVGVLAVIACYLAAGAAGSSAVVGGPPVSLAFADGVVWATLNAGAVAVDARSGRILRQIRTHFRYPTNIGASGGTVWIASVTNGYIHGALDRVHNTTAGGQRSFVFPHHPVMSIAVGRRFVWALLGPWKSVQLIRIGNASRKSIKTAQPTRVVQIVADARGSQVGAFGVSKNGEVVAFHGTARTTETPVAKLPAGVSALTVAADGVWLASRHTLYRAPLVPGKVKQLSVTGLPLQMVEGEGYLWLLSSLQPRTGTDVELSQISVNSGRVIGHRHIAGIPGGMTLGGGFLWVALDNTTRPALLRIHPKTLRADRLPLPHS